MRVATHSIMLRLFLLVLLVVPFTGNGQKAKVVIDKYFDAIGGKVAWNQINTIMKSGEHRNPVGGTAERLYWELHYKRPNKMKVWSWTQSSIVTFACYDGKTMLKAFFDSEIDTLTAREGNEFLTSSIDFPELILSRGTKVKYRGKSEVEGRACFVLEVRRSEWNRSRLYFIDAESNLLVCFKWKLPNSGTTYLDNYHLAENGVLFPSIERTVFNGQELTLVTQFIRINWELPDKEFTAPEY